MKKYKYALALLLVLIFFSFGYTLRANHVSTEIPKEFHVEIEKVSAADQADEPDEVLSTPAQALIEVEKPDSIPTTEEEVEKVEEEVNPYLVYEADFSQGSLVIDFKEGGPKKDIETKLVSPVNFGDFASLSEAFHVGEGYSVIVPDDYGNLILTTHSSYVAGTDKPLEAEPLRFFLERWGKEGIWVVERNLNSLEGVAGEIKINGENLHFVVKGAVRVLANELDSDPAKMLDIPEDVEILGNPFLEAAKMETDNGNRKLIINFCGWGPEDLPEWKRYSYYRYIIFVEIYEGELDKTLG